MPTTFNYPVIASTLAADGSDFMFTMSDGKKTRPVCAFLSPADENNEGHTAALIGSFGSREEGTWPKSVEIVSETLMLADFTNNNTKFPAKGAKLELDDKEWKPGAAKYGKSMAFNSPEVMLHSWGFEFSLVGEDLNSGYANHCRVRFPDTTHVVRLLINGGASKNGIHSLLPNDIDMFTIWKADQLTRSKNSNQVCITDDKGVNPCLLGLADLGFTDASDQSFLEFPNSYKSDGDNYLDLCFKVDAATWDTIGAIQIKPAVIYPPRGSTENKEHLVAVEKNSNYPYDLGELRSYEKIGSSLVMIVVIAVVVAVVVAIIVAFACYKWRQSKIVKKHQMGAVELPDKSEEQSQ